MKVKTIVLGITCMLFLSMCNNNTIKPPERKSNIPSEARWYGGNDGGAWVLINPTEYFNQYKVTVYFETDGSVWVDGLFKVCTYCQSDTLKIEYIRDNVSAFDGESVILKKIKQGKYCTLEPVK